ncbi:MAG: DUF3093 domain-containing protein [Mycobacterium sp.]
MTATRAASHTVRYRERLWVPVWWVLPSAVAAAIVATTVNAGIRGLPDWVAFAVLMGVAGLVLLWLSKAEVRVVQTDGVVELWAGQAHLPVQVVQRSAEVPRSAKSAALGRQLDPAAFVVHRPWVGPMVLLVLDDQDDPTPYWLISTRHPDRALSALRD